MTKISERIKRVRDTIRSACARVGRDPSEIKLVVVTKSATIEAIREVIQLGLTELGENRVQQLRKVSAQVAEFLEDNNDSTLSDKVNWHMIGHLQRNKVRHVLPDHFRAPGPCIYMAMAARLVALAPHVDLERLQARAAQCQIVRRKPGLKRIHQRRIITS